MFVDFFKNLIKGETYIGLWTTFKNYLTWDNMIAIKNKLWSAIKSIVNNLGKIVIITVALLVFGLVLVGVGIYIILMIISGIFKVIAYCSNWISSKIDKLLELFKDFVEFTTNKINNIANHEKVKELEKLLNDNKSHVTTISPEVIKEVIKAAKKEEEKKE